MAIIPISKAHNKLKLPSIMPTTAHILLLDSAVLFFKIFTDLCKDKIDKIKAKISKITPINTHVQFVPLMVLAPAIKKENKLKKLEGIDNKPYIADEVLFAVCCLFILSVFAK